jgi:hypothetical protein
VGCKSYKQFVYYGTNGILDAYAKVIRRLIALPTSRDAPHKLAASYRLTSLAPEITLHPRDFLLCHISMVDTGGAVWLDRAQWEKGEVRLRWRWFEEEQEGHLIEGGWLLGYAVLPGRSYEFTLEIATPSKPGNHQLELGLVSMQVTTFADQSTAPLRVPVQVTSPSLASSGG